MPRALPHPERRPVLVTGASSGIGSAVAVGLAAAGYPVALGARRTAICEELAVRIRADGGEAAALALDVTSDESVSSFVAGAEQVLGTAEVVVTCAGEVTPENAYETATPDFEAQLQLNLVGTQRFVAKVAPAMATRHRGDIVFVSSDVVRLPRPRMGAYVAAKNGVEGLARHDRFLNPCDVAAAVLAVISMPRGAHVTLLEAEPEAPLPAERPARGAACPLIGGACGSGTVRGAWCPGRGPRSSSCPKVGDTFQ
ncbi:NAD(P)-dependent dehydrogenase (short-subunit alcohol dehydrogenase family) [Streptosporangium album]|uniref:NAD(P)-dependent dehydrogenase (Short-subunit alcohol dehydrogenase family) n=1 Tax=Streptosporangium album TaxID=47479 RepID=A0A7W7RPF3_9ACTN|nr:SDR family NAD(P)-dependent oxidoreductase [Streptosporangium album]MBB4935749.1 NAD(P)-dependent dehydrogenase (short-subunit alcohol dehydrogenase family) [Streptosporangium album]